MIEGSLTFRIIVWVIYGITAAAVMTIVTIGALAGDDTCRVIVLVLGGSFSLGLLIGTFQVILEPLGKRYPFFKI